MNKSRRGLSGFPRIKRLIAMATVAMTAAMTVPALQMPASHAQTVAITHCEGECPRYQSRVTANQSNLVIHHLYAASVNGETSLSDWVAYRLTPEAQGIASLLPRSWQADRLIRFSEMADIVQAGEEELRLSENITRNANPYGGGEAALVQPENRARLAPMNSFGNTAYWSDLNNFSNMVPMPAAVRLGPWLQLEQQLNRLVAEGNEAYVIAGPLYLINVLSLSPSSADFEPAAFFKLVADDSGVAAFIFPKDMKQSDSFCQAQSSLAEVEELTSIDFYPGRRSRSASSLLYSKLGC